MKVLELTRVPEHLRSEIYHTLVYKQFIEEVFAVSYKFLGVVEGSDFGINDSKDNNNKIKLILPLVEVKSLLLGNKIISTAYLEYGGFSGDEKYVKEIVDFIDKNYKNKNNYLEIREKNIEFDKVLSENLVKKELYKRFLLPLTTEKEIWKNIQKSKRKAIKKALKSLQVKEIPLTDLDQLYELYCKAMHRFGSPPYGKKWFQCFYGQLVTKGRGKIFGSYYQGKLVSALVGFCYNKQVHILLAFSNLNYQEHRPSDAMHWQFIRWACSNNYTLFDFGRVREGSGQYIYKQKWGCKLEELPSYFLVWKGYIPIVDPAAQQRKVNVWKKLPLWLTVVLGHRLRRGLGI